MPNRVMARGEVVTTFDPCTDSELTIVGKLLCVPTVSHRQDSIPLEAVFS